MKGNEFSTKDLRPDTVEWLAKLHQTLTVKEYGKDTIRNYCQEMKLLFKYFNHKAVADIRQSDIEQYLRYIESHNQRLKVYQGKGAKDRYTLLPQTKIFAHPAVSVFNSYSQAVLSRLSRCHTAGIGVHHYRCSNEGCSHILFIIVAHW